jgi:hypothetical protein
MELLIEGEWRVFIPIKTFRAAHDLPENFSVALFEPKDYAGLGRVDTAGAELNSVREAVLAAMPQSQPPQVWMTLIPQLQTLFTDKLYEINPRVGLKDVEIEYAGAGFRDVCEAAVYAVARARASGDPPPVFMQIYGDWLNSTARVSQTEHEYTRREATWRIQIVNHAYGRAGMIVRLDSETHYVADAALGCPAEGYMLNLLAEVAARILT